MNEPLGVAVAFTAGLFSFLKGGERDKPLSPEPLGGPFYSQNLTP